MIEDFKGCHRVLGQQGAPPSPRPEGADRRQGEQTGAQRDNGALSRQIVGGAAGGGGDHDAVADQLFQAHHVVDHDLDLGGVAGFPQQRHLVDGDGPMFHHIGIYAYRRTALERFVSLKPSPLELRERLEQLRALEDGMRLDVAIVDTVPLGVDTPADLERARQLLAP